MHTKMTANLRKLRNLLEDGRLRNEIWFNNFLRVEDRNGKVKYIYEEMAWPFPFNLTMNRDVLTAKWLDELVAATGFKRAHIQCATLISGWGARFFDGATLEHGGDDSQPWVVFETKKAAQNYLRDRRAQLKEAGDD